MIFLQKEADNQGNVIFVKFLLLLLISTCAPPSLNSRLAENHEGLAELLGDKNLLKFLRYKDYDGEAAFNMITMINDYRINYPERWIPEGKGPRDYAYVYNLRSIEILRHRNPIDGSAIVVLR